MTCWYYVSSPRFTVALAADRGTIVDGPPIVRARWIGKPVGELCSAWRVDRVELLGCRARRPLWKEVKTMDDFTFNDLVNEAIVRAQAHRDLSGPQAAREFSIAITNLEDALTRFNGGVYRRAGTWNRADAERVTGLVEIPEDV